MSAAGVAIWFVCGGAVPRWLLGVVLADMFVQVPLAIDAYRQFWNLVHSWVLA